MAETVPVPNARTTISVWADAAERFDRWQGGEAAGLDDLVRTASPALWQIARGYGLDDDHAQEVVQATWLALVHRRESVTEPTAIGTWLTTTVRQEAERAIGVAANAAPGPSARTGATTRLDGDQARLRDGVQELSPRCRLLLRIAAFGPRAEQGAVEPARSRCLTQLRDALTAGSAMEYPR